MAFTPTLATTFLIIATLCILLPEAHAFGAGDIPDFAYLNDKAFRHGDIESVLENLAKTAAGAAIGGSSLFGFAASVVKAAVGPSKFNKSDIKKVYFGNWLRDYSQAMDIAGLSKLSADTLVLVVSVLAFMTFGFSTEEFEVTADRLGVYLPVEHIDNPKGYAEQEGDAREYHPKLRPPVDPRELEIDENTGMKKYMATENEGWDTSTGFIRRTLVACIEHGRRANGAEGADLWEAYRLLGTGLHTLEDLLAHSNWCELALRKMGHEEVFCHVGDEVIIDTPNGPAPPLVTGTFGGADFLHSLLGEAGDKLSQASVTDLSGKLDQASHGGNAPDLGALKGILGKLMGGGEEEEKLNHGEEIKQAAQGYHFDPDNVCPPEVKQQLLDLLKWHDDVMRSVIKKISMVPGLANLLEEFSNALNAYIYTVLAPYLTPILKQATAVLDEGSKAVIDNDDQYEVFNNPEASDPSHSMLSKDHFGLILNEPAGKIAQIIVEHTVNLIVEAWSNDDDPNHVLDQILEAFHHPYYNSGNSTIQHSMFEMMEGWIGGLGSDEAAQTIQALTKESVRDHKNKRLGSENQSFDEPGYGSCGHGHSQRSSGGYGSTTTTQPSYNAEVQSHAGGYGGHHDETSSYGSRQTHGGGYGGRVEHTEYGGRQASSGYGGGYGGRQEHNEYGGRQEGSGYGYQGESGYGGHESSDHGSRNESSGFGGHRESPGYGGSRDQYYQGTYGESTGYGRQSGDDHEGRSSHVGGYGGQHEERSSYGGQERSTYSGGYGGRRDDDNNRSSDDSDDDKRKKHGKKHKDSDGSNDDSSKQKGHETSHRDGYAPAYQSGYYGGGNDTFGVERMRVRDDDDDDSRRRHGGGGYGGHSGGYGGGYGGGY